MTSDATVRYAAHLSVSSIGTTEIQKTSTMPANESSAQAAANAARRHRVASKAAAKATSANGTSRPQPLDQTWCQTPQNAGPHAIGVVGEVRGTQCVAEAVLGVLQAVDGDEDAATAAGSARRQRR